MIRIRRTTYYTLLLTALVLGIFSPAISAQLGGFSPVDNFAAWSLDEYESAGGTAIASFNEAPMLADMVASGDLPMVDERLPMREDIQVVQPRESIGTYGGELRYNATNPTSFGNIGWSAWDQHLMGYSTNWEEVFPNVAKSIEMSDDLTTATVTLRRGMKWSDGAPFTADDIMFWYEDVMLHPDLPNLPSQLLASGEAPVIEKVDDLTVTFTYPVPNPAFLVSVARFGSGAPFAPRHYLEQWHADYNDEAQALAEAEGYDTWAEAFEFHRESQTGDNQLDPNLPVLKPWTLESVDEFGNKFFRRNPYYWKVDTDGNQLPYVDSQARLLIGDLEVVKLNIQAGELDYADKLDISDLPVLVAAEDAGNYTTMRFPFDAGAANKYQFNITVNDPVLREIFNDIRFRQAMSLAVNRAEINETLFFGLGVPRQWGVSSANPFYEDWMGQHFAEYDPDAANALLDDMGLEMGADGIRLRPDGEPLKVILWDAINRIPMSELMTEYWKAVGVDTEINPSTREAFQQALLANEVQASVWFADVVSERDMYTRPIWFRPPYGLDGTPVGGGLVWRNWWLTDGAEGEEPPEYYREQMELADRWQATQAGSDEYYELGTELVGRTVEQMLQIGTVGEVPVIYTRSNRLQNFPSQEMIFIDHLRGAHSDQWYLSE